MISRLSAIAMTWRLERNGMSVCSFGCVSVKLREFSLPCWYEYPGTVRSCWRCHTYQEHRAACLNRPQSVLVADIDRDPAVLAKISNVLINERQGCIRR